jgi:hypothetical protein
MNDNIKTGCPEPEQLQDNMHHLHLSKGPPAAGLHLARSSSPDRSQVIAYGMSQEKTLAKKNLMGQFKT